MRYRAHVKNCKGVQEGEEGDDSQEREEQQGVEQWDERQNEQDARSRGQEVGGRGQEQEVGVRGQEHEEGGRGQEQEVGVRGQEHEEGGRGQEQEVILTFQALGMSGDTAPPGPQPPMPVLINSPNEGGSGHTSPLTLTHLETLTPALMQQDLGQDIVDIDADFSYDSQDMFG